MHYALLLLLLLNMVNPSPVQAQSQTLPDLNELDRYIEKAVEDFNLTGLTIAIVRDTSIIFKGAYGLKDADKNIKMDTGALFNIASCSKAFTGACMAALVHDKKIKWDDKVIDYIPDFQLKDPYITRKLNMVDILSHRTGLGTFYGDLLWYETDYSDQEIIKRMRHLPITNDFRSQYGYQNNMFIIAGEIHRLVTGQTWSDFVYKRIFQPLGMSESRTCKTDLRPGQNLAYPHIKGEKIVPSFVRPHPAASIFSNVEELSAWMIMLNNQGKYRGKKVFSPEVVRQLFTSRTLLRTSMFMQMNGSNFYTYGLGWFMFDHYGKKVVEHGGGMPGYISKVTLVPEEKLGIAILTNDMTGLPTALRYKILDFFFSDRDTDWAEQFLVYKKQAEDREQSKVEEAEKSRIKGTSPSLDLEQYTGMYEDVMYGPAEIVLTGGKLHLTLLPAKEMFTSRMDHWQLDTFRVRFRDKFLPDGYIAFSLNSKGKVTGFSVDLPNPDFHFFNLDFKKKK